MKQFTFYQNILLVFFLGGFLWAGYGLYGFLGQRALVREGHWAEARLAEVNLQRVGYRQRLTYVLEFSGSDGSLHRLKYRPTIAWDARPQEGDTLRVVYPAGHPELARPLPHPERAPFGLPAGLFLIVATGMGWGLMVGGSRLAMPRKPTTENRQPPPTLSPILPFR